MVGTVQTAAGTSFATMQRLSKRVSDVIGADPAVETVTLALGATSSLTENQGRLFIAL